MRKALALCLAAAVVSAAHSVDFGALLRSSTGFTRAGGGSFVLSEDADASLNLRVPFTSDGLSYLATEGLYRFSLLDGDVGHLVDLPLLKLNFLMDSPGGFVQLAAGRFTVSDITSRVFAQTSDGVSLMYSSPSVDFSVYAGYTGLVNSLATSMVGTGDYELAGCDVYALSLPYMAFSLGAAFPHAFLSQTVAADVWGFVGTQGLDRTAVYGTLSLNGRVAGSLYHSTQGTFSVLLEDGAEYGMLASLALDYYLPVLGGMVSAKAAFASEDFGTITETYSLAYGALWQDILTAGASFSLKPLPSVYVVVGADAAFDATDFGYGGVQVVGSLSWQVASDVMLSAGAVHFFAAADGESATDIKLLALVSL